MQEKFYGISTQTQINNEVSQYVEEVSLRGYTVIPNIFSSLELDQWRERIDIQYSLQEKEFGREFLTKIQEADICRAPIIYDFTFIQLAAHPYLLSVVERLLGNYFILNLQNAIINRPNQIHHQYSWHRDLPYQNFVISRPISINVLFAIDEFSETTGGTHFLPFSHRSEDIPSDKYIDANCIAATVPAGSAIVFDSMLLHRAGVNKSQIIRRSVNHMYTIPIIKQQYDLPRGLGERPELDPAVTRLLGYTSQVPINAEEWRKARAARLLKPE